MSSFLDLTLVIQVVHVIVAYWLLTTFFLKPAFAHYAVLEEEKEQVQQLSKDLEHRTSLLKKEAAQELTRQQRHILARGWPHRAHSPQESLQHEVRSGALNAEISEKEKQQITQQIVARLKKEIIDAVD